MSDPVRPHRRQPTRALPPLDSPGKNTGVDCHCRLQCMKVKVKSLSRVQFLATPWTAAYQAPLSMGFSRQEYWSGVPLPSPLGALSNRNLVFHGSGGWKSKIIALAGLISFAASLLGSQISTFLLCPFRVFLLCIHIPVVCWLFLGYQLY